MKYVEFRDWIFVAKLFGILNITLFLFISFKKKCLLALFHKWVLKFWGKISWLIDLKNSMISNTLPFHDFLVTDNLKTIKGQCVTLLLRFFIFLFKKHKWNSCSSSTVPLIRILGLGGKNTATTISERWTMWAEAARSKS